MVVSNGDVGEQSEGGRLVVHDVAEVVVEVVKADISLAGNSGPWPFVQSLLSSGSEIPATQMLIALSVPFRVTSIVNLVVYFLNIL